MPHTRIKKPQRISLRLAVFCLSLSIFDFRFSIFLVLMLMFFHQLGKIIHADGFFFRHNLGFGPVENLFSDHPAISCCLPAVHPSSSFRYNCPASRGCHPGSLSQNNSLPAFSFGAPLLRDSLPGFGRLQSYRLQGSSEVDCGK